MKIKHWFLLSLILAAVTAAHNWPGASKSQVSVPAGQWSSGDREESGNRKSLGWKKLGSIPQSNFTVPSKSWSPAVASTTNRTAIMWAPSKAERLVGFLWEESSGTWSKDGTFFTKALPFDTLKSAPALVHRGSGLLDVVVLGKDQYYHAHHQNGVWSEWEPIGGAGGSPAITASKTGPTKLDVWVIDGGTVRRKRWQQATGWQEKWEGIGNPEGVLLTAGPGATVRSDNTIDIVAPAQADGQLWHKHFSPTDEPSEWKKIPGNTFTQPSLVSPAADQLEVWVKGASDGTIFHLVWNPNLGKWEEFPRSINDTPTNQPVTFSTGPAVTLSAGLTTVAGISEAGEVLVRSWVASVPPKASATPTMLRVRRPVKSTGSFVSEGSAENTLTIAPACNAVYLSLGAAGDLQQQKMTCVLKGAGAVVTVTGAHHACVSKSSNNIPDLNSTDHQVAVLKNGTVLWLRQRGGVTTPTSRTNNQPRSRGNLFRVELRSELGRSGHARSL
jgi:hypothetical protein